MKFFIFSVEMKTLLLLLLKQATAVDTFSFHQQQYFHLVVLSASERSINSHLLSHLHHHRPIVDIRQSATRWSIFGLSVCLSIFILQFYLFSSCRQLTALIASHFILSLTDIICLFASERYFSDQGTMGEI